MSRLPPLPNPPRPPSRTPFPLIAVIAPIVGAIAIGAIVRSPYVLVFAVLSPLIAIATMLDGRRQARAHRRAEATRFERECRAFEAAIVSAHRDETEQNQPSPLDGRADSGRPALVRIGTAAGRSAIAVDLTVPLGEGDAERRIAALVSQAAVNPRLPTCIPRGVVTVLGNGLVADAIERRLRVVQGVEVRRDGVNIPVHAATNGATNGAAHRGTVLVVRSATRVDLHIDERVVAVRPEFDSAETVRVESRQTEELALPAHVAWESIADEGEGFAVPIGRDADGVVLIDLVDDGPHAIVGGTTGSGKSELLRSIALGWAASAPPDMVQLLFVDFKGGATFAGLTELPHCAGLVTDLDASGAVRVLHSLSAEVRRRERLLADHGVRDIRDNPDVVPRLLVLVDEYAAMLEAHPELAPLIADLAARGRSLGVHLVLCTQAPSATVREAVAANCPVRVSFRITDAAAASFLGRSAPELVGSAPGRALMVGARHHRDDAASSTTVAARLVHVGCITDIDIARVRELWKDSVRPSPPWLPPLPLSLDRSMLLDVAEPAPVAMAEHDDSFGFGIVDLPDEQRRAPATWFPGRDGPLGIVGAPRSGRSTALAALKVSASAVDTTSVVLPRELPDAWALLEQLSEGRARVLLLADDLDVLLARARDSAHEVLERWDDAVMAVLGAGGAVAASMSPGSAGRGPLASRFSSRLLLRTADADEHAMLGGPRGGYDRSAPPGRGWWAGHAVHVVHEREPLGTGSAVVPTAWAPSESADSVIVCRSPTRVAAVLRSEYPHVTICTDLQAAARASTVGDVTLRPRALIGSVGEWHAVWAHVVAVRSRSEVAVIDVPPGDTRSLLGLRGALPPLDASRGDVWVVAPGEPPRRRRWSALAAPTSQASGAAV